MNLNKNKTESKMEKPTHTFSETNLVLQLIQESQIKVKLWWVRAREWKKSAFFYRLYYPKEVFLTFVFYFNVRCTEYSFRICFISKSITSYTLLHVSKIVESLQCTLKQKNVIALIIGTRAFPVVNRKINIITVFRILELV